jgi:hypothetical protein
MYDKKHQLAEHAATEVTLTKEERYELIALIAQRFNEISESEIVGDKPLWNSEELDVNFDDIVIHYN